MAKVIVEYTVKIKQTLDWPDDELGDFNYENLEANLEPTIDDVQSDYDISSVILNGEQHYF